MRITLRAGLTIAMLIACASAARADMAVYYHAGSWDAFSGPGTDGRPVCGIGNTNPADHRSLSLRVAVGGDDSVLFEARKPTWTIPAGTQLPVVMQIGLDAPWNQQGVGNGQVVQWTLDSAAMQTFDAQFRRAGSMTMSFPTGNELPWTIALTGSAAISNAFGRCVTDLARRTGVAPSAPTQPFGQEPARQPAQPTQPTQQR